MKCIFLTFIIPESNAATGPKPLSQ
jgi:hypothetical protein